MKHILLCLGIFGCLNGSVKARDLGQWDAVDPANRAEDLTSTSEQKLKFRTTNSSGTEQTRPGTAWCS
jgi:hypothetical protein